MAFTKVAVAFLLLCSMGPLCEARSDGDAVEGTPVAKVIDLLNKLKAQCEKEGTEEQRLYDVFACFCKRSTEEQAVKIGNGKSGIETITANIAGLVALKASKEKDKNLLKNKNQQMGQELAAQTALYLQKKAEHSATVIDQSKAIEAMDNAIKALESSERKPTSIKLIQLRQSVADSLELAKALGKAPQGHKQEVVSEFLQDSQKGQVDPNDPEYKFKSSGIIQIIQELRDEFAQQRDSANEDFAKITEGYQASKKAFEAEMHQNLEQIAILEQEIKDLQQVISQNRDHIIKNELNIQDEDQFLKDVAVQCEARAKDWDLRSATRASEIEAITKATEILSGKVEEADRNVNRQEKEELVQTEAASFVQVASNRQITLRSGTETDENRKQKVLSLLASEGKRLNSAVLSSLAMKVAMDPFNAVKMLITDLVAKLRDEQNAELSKKGFCDTEISKALHDRDLNRRAVKRLDAKLDELEVQKVKLANDISDMEADIVQLKADLKHASEMREEEKAENAATTKEAKDGLEALQTAIATLKDFYRLTRIRASRHDSNYETQSSRLHSDHTGTALDAGFHGAYHGKQEDSEAIVGLMEEIENDFKNTIREVKESEEKAYREHVEFERTTKSDIASKQTQKKIDQEEIEATDTSISEALTDVQTHTTLQDAALKTLADLKPACVENEMSTKERVEKRNNEIEALHNALCELDTEGNEPGCEADKFTIGM